MTYPEPLQIELKRIVNFFADSGVEVFLFGSCAHHWPEVPRNADMDIGYRFTDASLDESQKNMLEKQLFDALSQLPSVRPFDLVNFEKVSQDFKRIASQSIRKIA